MQDKDDKLDELYRNKLKEFKLPVSDKVLTNIKKGILVENKKKGLGWGLWLVLFTLIVGASVGGYFIVSTYSSNKNTTASLPENNAATNNKSTLATDSKKISADNRTNSTSTSTSSEIENTNQPIATTTPTLADTKTTVSSTEKEETSHDEKINTGNKNSKTSAPKAAASFPSSIKKHKENKSDGTKNENKNLTNAPVGSDNRATTTNTETQNKEQGSKSETKNKLERGSAGIAKSNSITLDREIKMDDNTVNNTTDKQNQSNGEVLNSSSENKTAALLQKTTDSIYSTKEIDRIKQNRMRNDSIQLSMLAKAEDSIKLKKAQPPPPPIVDDKKADKKTSFFIGITGGPSFGFRTLNTGNNTGAANRNDNETKQTTYNAGVEAGVVLKNNLFVNIGVRLNNRSENYHINGALATSSTSINPWLDSLGNLAVDTAGNPLGFDTITTNTPGHNEFSSKNNYQFISIPIMVGYNFSIKDKLFVTPRIGISIDYLLSGSSSWLDTKTNQVVEYSKSKGSFNNVTISGKINLDIGWNITKKWSLILQPGYTRSLNSIYKKEDELKLYPYGFDVNLGVRFRF